MRRIGRDVSAAEFWSGFASAYSDDMGSAYNADRLTAVRSLVQPLRPHVIVDFGCGDGVLMSDFPQGQVVGIEPEPLLADRARARCGSATVLTGGVDKLADLDRASTDLLLAINVLAYLTDEEDGVFYQHAERILKPGGILVVTHSNELFAMFSLNTYTVGFFREHFNAEIAPLLARPDEPHDPLTYNIRENPLVYRHKLARYGFAEERQAFMHFHVRSPLLGKPAEHDATPKYQADEQWKLMFQCSVFGSRAIRR